MEATKLLQPSVSAPATMSGIPLTEPVFAKLSATSSGRQVRRMLVLLADLLPLLQLLEMDLLLVYALLTWSGYPTATHASVIAIQFSLATLVFVAIASHQVLERNSTAHIVAAIADLAGVLLPRTVPAHQSSVPARLMQFSTVLELASSVAK